MKSKLSCVGGGGGHPLPEMLAESTSPLSPRRFPEVLSRIKTVGDAFPALDLRKDFKTKENRVKTRWMNSSVSETGSKRTSAYKWVLPGAPWAAILVFKLGAGGHPARLKPGTPPWGRGPRGPRTAH